MLRRALRDYIDAMRRVLSSRSINTDAHVTRMFARLGMPSWVPQAVATSTSKCEWNRVTQVITAAAEEEGDPPLTFPAFRS